MIDIKRIFPECNADTLLIELVMRKGRPPHYKGCTNVAKALNHLGNKNRFATGLIDKDKFKNTPTYFGSFVVKEDKEKTEGLILKHLPDTQLHIILICKEFEPWLLARAAECGVDPKKYGFESIKKLEKASKPESSPDRVQFKDFLSEVIGKNPPSIQTLRKWLTLALE